MKSVTARDDSFHRPPGSDPYWSETAWFGFAVPERGLAGTVYPLFRPNLGTCSVAVVVWDDTAHEPWRVRYARTLWHQPMPGADLTDLEVAGLRYETLEPLHRYRVAYRDGDRLTLDLEYTGLLPPQPFGLGEDRGHFDQPCRVMGSLRLHGEQIAVDGFEMRDRSWHVRDDTRTTRASYSYAIASGDRLFHAAGFSAPGSADTTTLISGFRVAGGELASLAAGTRRVLERSPAGYPLRVAVEARDAAGRTFEAVGRAVSRLASQATPGMFAWMSLIEWEWDGGSAFGEDQDVWSPDLLPPTPSG